MSIFEGYGTFKGLNNFTQTDEGQNLSNRTAKLEMKY